MLPFRPDRVHLVQEVPFTAQLVNHALLSNLSARLRPFNNIGLGFFDLGLSKFPLRHMLLQAFTNLRRLAYIFGSLSVFDDIDAALQ